MMNWWLRLSNFLFKKNEQTNEIYIQLLLHSKDYAVSENWKKPLMNSITAENFTKCMYNH